MWRNLLILTAAAAGLSIAVANNADAQRIGGSGQGGANVGMQGGANVNANAGAKAGRMTSARTRTSVNARAQARGPEFRPAGWSHGRKVGWHCRVGARGCIPPGQR